ncbi:MAG: heavy metal-associated domain-containing protein [Candidatus Paceibacterota bacterium]
MQSSINTATFIFSILLMGVFVFIPAEKSNAQILELDQKIFGMDCAPCAKGVENRMKRLNGVLDAELDLNSGEARLIFSDSHDTSLQQIQRSIIDGGFSPKEARIKIKGNLRYENQTWMLYTESNDPFVLHATDDLSETDDEKVMIIEGIVADKSNNEDWSLTILKIHSTG